MMFRAEEQALKVIREIQNLDKTLARERASVPYASQSKLVLESSFWCNFELTRDIFKYKFLFNFEYYVPQVHDKSWH